MLPFCPGNQPSPPAPLEARDEGRTAPFEIFSRPVRVGRPPTPSTYRGVPGMGGEGGDRQRAGHGFSVSLEMWFSPGTGSIRGGPMPSLRC